MITNEIKAKIFAQYLGQNTQVRKKNDDGKDYLIGRICEVTHKSNHGDWVMVWFDEVHTVTNQTWNESSSNAHTFFFGEDEARLMLKPLSAIIDEDAIEVANIFYSAKSTHTNETLIAQGKDLVSFIVNEDSIHNCNYNQDFMGIIYTVQYLQSRGYALPYMEYTVEQLVEAGIYKLITE